MAFHSSNILDLFISQVVLLVDHNLIKYASLWFNTVQQRIISFLFINLVCVLPLSRSIYCRVYKGPKLEKIVNKTFINCQVLQLVIAGKYLCSIPTRNYMIYSDYNNYSQAQKASVSIKSTLESNTAFLP